MQYSATALSRPWGPGVQAVLQLSQPQRQQSRAKSKSPPLRTLAWHNFISSGARLHLHKSSLRLRTFRSSVIQPQAALKSLNGSAARENGAVLPEPPTNSGLKTVLPYVWNLAAGDKTLSWRLAVAIVLLVMSKASGLAGPVFFKRAMDNLSQAPAQVFSAENMRSAVLILVMASLSKAVSAGLNELRYLVFAPLGQSTGRRVGVQLLDHILRLDLAFHLERQTGALTRILDRAQRSVVNIFRAVVFTFVPTAVELAFVCVLLAQQVSSLVAGIVLTTFAAYVAYTVVITSAAAASRKEVNKLENLATGKAVDALLNYETVVQFNNQQLEVHQYNELLRRYQKTSLDAERLSAALNAGQALILAMGVAAVMALTGMNVARGTMTIGDLVLANGLILQISGPLQFLGYLYRDLRQSLVDLESLFAILGTKPRLKDGTVTLNPSSVGVKLWVKHIRFSYSPAREVLGGVSFAAEPGQSIAIVGTSGSGKSTIVKLLLRLYDPDSGSLYIDDLDLRTLSQISLRNTVAVVPQDTVLFNDTIYHNIAYGRPGATEEEIHQASKLARLHDSVKRMPEGYATIVGERGLKLSGGEKQRVAIARAFLKSPRLLICDEATSALDSGTEAAILKSLKELAAGRTCVFIAHRLSTIKHCDKILVMDAGRVIEEGSHFDLMKRQGVYARMWALQESEGSTKILR
ncbi:hypothetical protein R1sor_018746 [Riccia sorocarpa]|uniref:Uncharacterized protein n=1 Tax=Riccia sorocarpa TaxID=122646 RepID=A0ABD3IDW1_9MARC